MKVCDFGHHHIKHKIQHKGCHHNCQHKQKGGNYQKECKQFKNHCAGHGGVCRKRFVFKRHAPYHGCHHGHHIADHHGYHLQHRQGHQHQRCEYFGEQSRCQQHSHRSTENVDRCQHSERPRADSHSWQRECQNYAGDQNTLIAGPSGCKQRCKSV